MLPRSARRHVSFFVYVAFKYGHTFSGTTFRQFIVEEVEKIVNNNAHVIDYSELIQKGFVKYRRPRQQLAMFNFVGKCWMDFFEKENKSNLYLYIDPLKYFKIDNRPDIVAIINSWRKKRLNLYEKDAFSLIQVVIPGNVIEEAECRKKIKFIAGKINTEIALGIKAYMTWLGLVCEADEYGVQTLKRAYVPHHEQGSNGARAIGLRLWDLVHFNKMSFADATRTVQDASKHCRSDSEYRTLQRDYALATACIKHIELLDYSDI